MKKLFLIASVMFITLGLAGCDLISPQQVEEISEQYCRDNPTAEICQGDTIDDLLDETVLNVFNTIISEYSDDDNTTFCDDYFSVTNTELLDSCRESRSGLVPDDYDGYTVKGIERQTALSTENVYEITVVSEDLLTEVVFTIGLVNVDNLMYINSWSYDTTTYEPQDLDVPLAEARAYFEEFIAAYLDDTISSYDVCSEYFSDKVSDCIEERDKSFLTGLDVTLDGMTDEGDGLFEVEMTFSDDEMTVPETQFDEVNFSYDEDGHIVMTWVHDDYTEEWLNALDAGAILDSFIYDYQTTMSDADLNNKYFDNQM